MGSSISKRKSSAAKPDASANKMIMRAMAGDTVVAETTADKIVKVEGNAYFPPDALKEQYFKSSAHTTVCGWKGTANYKDVVAEDGKVFSNAAWYYEEPKTAASNIKGYYAFWKGVTVQSASA